MSGRVVEIRRSFIGSENAEGCPFEGFQECSRMLKLESRSLD